MILRNKHTFAIGLALGVMSSSIGAYIVGTSIPARVEVRTVTRTHIEWRQFECPSLYPDPATITPTTNEDAANRLLNAPAGFDPDPKIAKQQREAATKLELARIKAGTDIYKAQLQARQKSGGMTTIQAPDFNPPPRKRRTSSAAPERRQFGGLKPSPTIRQRKVKIERITTGGRPRIDLTPN
jgi:hypothetical protein